MTTQHPGVFRLYLLRHARAAWPAPGGRDFDRPLDARGLAEAHDVALDANTAGLVPARIVSSTALRCRQTTAAFLDVFGDIPADFDDQLYSDGPEAYLAQVDRHHLLPSLMLVGHNPMIEALAGMLASNDGSLGALAFGYPTAGLLALEFTRPLGSDLARRGDVVNLTVPALT
jgi:phosphohistidine phosphatase